jgi:hypothetical protein
MMGTEKRYGRRALEFIVRVERVYTPFSFIQWMPPDILLRGDFLPICA